MKIHYGRTTGPILLKCAGELDLSLLHPPFRSPPGVLKGGLRGCRVSDAGFVASSLAVRAISRPHRSMVFWLGLPCPGLLALLGSV